MARKKYVWTKKDLGDFVTEQGGRREWLAATMEGLGEDELAEELEKEPSDDYSEEDDAIEAMNEHTAPGLLWAMHPDDPGTLILQEESWFE
jgi:hypothetical protein